MKKYIVILTDDTVGKLEAEEVHAGDTVEVELTDENGGMVRKTGAVASVEDEKEMWQ